MIFTAQISHKNDISKLSIINYNKLVKVNRHSSKSNGNFLQTYSSSGLNTIMGHGTFY